MFQIGMVGTGYWGPNMANSLERTGKGRLKWLCDARPENMAALAKRYPHAGTTTSAAEVFADPSVDAVFIATPTTSHYVLVRQALEAGKHVLVEKPITIFADEALALSRLAAEKKLILMVGHVFEYNATIRAVHDLIHSGELGEVYYMHFERTNLGPVRTDVNAMWDLATHDVSIMCDFMKAQPVEVTARGAAYLNKGVEDVVFGTFTFDGGVNAHVHASWLNPRKVRNITVVGSKKMVVWDDLDMRQPIRLFDKRVGLPPLESLTGSFLEHKTMVFDSGVTVPVVQTNEPLLAEIDHFLDCLASGATPRSDGFSGARVVHVIEAACRSMAEGSRAVPITPLGR
ncbi:MAG: Gfo/Idh/MocA family protein [Actinomycetota bacterium]